jgi:hypothetical protein
LGVIAVNSGGTPSLKDSTPQETAVLLQRILTALEKDRRDHRLEITCAIVLSLATMSSAWCAYQSTRWGGVQTFRLAAANKANRLSSAANLTALQFQAFDASMGISWMQAKYEGNKRQETFLFDRFRPEMKKAVEAWLKTDPFSNPAAPLGPIKMAEYAQTELAEAKRQDERSAKEYEAAMLANQTSDAYVLLTVLFASVLFFGGIAGTLDSRRLRISILAIALALFVVTFGFLATMPICQA